MNYKKLTLSEASELMNQWKEDSDAYLEEKLDTEYLNIRKELIESYAKVDNGQKYSLDYKFGILLNYILQKNGFTLRDASDDGVWRYLSMCVVPDLVGRRWGKDAEIRYYKQSSRIWLKTIWWYIHLSWQGSPKETAKVISSNTTDQILQLVDRSGSKGYYVEAYRSIMYYYWVAKQKDKSISESDFRRIMTLHTAMCRTIEPGLYVGGDNGYVKMLFSKLGINIEL